MAFIYLIVFMSLEAKFCGLFGGGESVFTRSDAKRTVRANLERTGRAILPGTKKSRDRISVDFAFRTVVGIAEVIVTTSSDEIAVGVPIVAKLAEPIKERIVYRKQVRADPGNPFSPETGFQEKSYPNDERRDLYCIGFIYGNRNPDHRLDEELGFLILDVTDKFRPVLIFWPYDRLTPLSQEVALANYRENCLDPGLLPPKQKTWLKRNNPHAPSSERIVQSGVVFRKAIPGGIGIRIG